MDIQKIGFVGLGGAGQRHLRVFRSLLPRETAFIGYRRKKQTPLLNPNFTVNPTDTLQNKYGIELTESLEACLDEQPDLLVISTPTSMHHEVALQAAQRGIGVLVEKPYAHTLEGFDALQEAVLGQQVSFFISYQRRYHPFLRRVKEILASGGLGKIINAQFDVASFVPAWHPYENFRDLYACRKDLGGGVLLTEIHELDLCYWYFGTPKAVSCTGGNLGPFPLDGEDTASVTLDYGDAVVQVNLCFMQQRNRRALHIAGTEGYLHWDGMTNKLLVANYASGEAVTEVDADLTNDDMFIAQAKDVLERISATHNKQGLDAAWGSLAIVEAAKASMAGGQKESIPAVEIEKV